MLEKTLKDVNSFDQKLLDNVNNMIDTMRHFNGVGLAANQIGINQRIIVLEVNQNSRYPEQQGIPLMVLVNPQIATIGNETEGYLEGCLSIDDYRAEVVRSKAIEYQAFDQYGNVISGVAEKFLARIIQHEVDHLNGILFTQRIAV